MVHVWSTICTLLMLVCHKMNYSDTPRSGRSRSYTKSVFKWSMARFWGVQSCWPALDGRRHGGHEVVLRLGRGGVGAHWGPVGVMSHYSSCFLISIAVLSVFIIYIFNTLEAQSCALPVSLRLWLRLLKISDAFSVGLFSIGLDWSSDRTCW